MPATPLLRSKGMNAEALLKSQGWRGAGHSLDAANRGISKPLLVSKKVDVLGVGLNKHAAVSDQWWMRAFDQGLKDFGSGKETTLSTVKRHGMFAGGLHGRFVKGEGVPGTFEEDEEMERLVEGGEGKRKRNRDEHETEKEADIKSKKVKVDSEDGESADRKDHNKKVQVVRHSVDQHVAAFVAEAQARQLLTKSDNDLRTAGDNTIYLVSLYGRDAVARVFTKAGLSPGQTLKPSGSAKKKKYDRNKGQRDLKRVAKAFILEQLPPAERKLIEDFEAVKSGSKNERKRAKQEKKVLQTAQKAAAKEAKAVHKKEARVTKTEERAPGADVPTNMHGEADLPKKVKKSNKRTLDEFASGEAEIQIEPKSGKKARSFKNQSSSEAAPGLIEGANLDFVIDTAGDASLPALENLSTSDKVIDDDGNLRYTIDPITPVPLDSTIWEGISVKTLPKRVRAARRQWMAEQRTAKNPGRQGRTEESKSKKENKLDRIEKFSIKILVASRKAGMANQIASIDGIEDVQLVKVKARSESDKRFTKEEMALARTVARRTLKSQKKAEKKETKKDRKLQNGRR